MKWHFANDEDVFPHNTTKDNYSSLGWRIDFIFKGWKGDPKPFFAFNKLKKELLNPPSGNDGPPGS